MFVSHSVAAVLEQKGGHWRSSSRFLKFQAILVEQDDITILTSSLVNPAAFLAICQMDNEPLHHKCIETVEPTYSSHPDFKETPVLEAKSWYTKGSSFIRAGQCRSGYAITTETEVIEAQPLPPGTLAQKVDIIALT